MLVGVLNKSSLAMHDEKVCIDKSMEKVFKS